MLKTKAKPDNRHSRGKAKSLKRRQLKSKQVAATSADESSKPGFGHNSGNTRFPKTIAAGTAIERSMWTLGDALVEECGPPSQRGEHTGSDNQLLEVQAELKAAGCEYSFNYLRDIRRTAANFPNEERSAFGALPFSYFLIAGTPENLRSVREKAKANHVELSARFIRETLNAEEIDIPGWEAKLSDELEHANAIEKAFEDRKGFSQLSEKDRAKFFKACEALEEKWGRTKLRFHPRPKQTPDPEKAAA